jgi:transposase
VFGIVGVMTRPFSIPLELWDQIPETLRSAIAAVVFGLESQVAGLETRVAELEAKLDQNSSNSSKPPSSDGPQVKPAPPKSPSGKKRGGQPGHAKHERVILPPDEVFDHKPSRCRGCDTTLTGDDPAPIIDQVVDLPVKLRHVVHHRRHTLECRCCGIRTTAKAPEVVSGFGPKLTAAVAYFSGVGRMSKRTIRVLLADLCGIPLSLGSVSQLEQTVSRSLAASHQAAHEHVQGLDANVDETGWKQGKSKAWLWVAVTNSLTVFLIRPKRNRAAFDDLAGPKPGVLTTDRFPVYTHLSGRRRQVCWAHLRRDFQAMIDRQNAGSEIGQDLRLHADILFEHWQHVRDGTRSRRWFRRTHVSWLRDEVKDLLKSGTASACAKTAGMCREILAVEESLWTFARRDGVEPTNNAAERAVRHAVCWRKTSYGTDSERGSRFVERILTVVATCRQQNRNILDFLIQTLNHQNPSLLTKQA